MKTLRTLLLESRPSFAIRRGAAFFIEAVLWASGITALEVSARFAKTDASDLMAVACGTLFIFVMVRASKSGLLIATRHIGGALVARCKQAVKRLTPRYAVAFRSRPEVPSKPDAALDVALWIGAVAAATFVAFGAQIFDGLLFLKTDVSYTVYLVLLAFVWAVLAFVVFLGAVAGAQWVQQMGGGTRTAPTLILCLGWLAGMLVTAIVPGIVSVAAVALFAGIRIRWLWRRPRTPYLFCRRDADGYPRTVRVGHYLVQAYFLIALLLMSVVAVGQSQRMWSVALPEGPFALTTGLGTFAAVSAVFLMARVGAHFHRLTGSRHPPELPLRPTAWSREPDETDERAGETQWMRVAREHGWTVTRGPRAPSDGYDLVAGDPSDSRRFVPRPDQDDADTFFQLQRRFHVVMRRRFYRPFKRLYKALRAKRSYQGSGFLFCPHVWLVAGVVRDVDPQAVRGSGSLVGPSYVGPLYGDLFEPRVRRYLGNVLRKLEIDIVFWEDAIRYPELRRVFGVAFEIYDQDRAPLQARHFVGVPKVRVMIHEEDAESDGSGSSAGRPTQAPGYARVLVIMRDRSEDEDVMSLDPEDASLRSPALV